MKRMFEGIAKTNTTHTNKAIKDPSFGLRVLLKQILPTQYDTIYTINNSLRVLLKQILPTLVPNRKTYSHV